MALSDEELLDFKRKPDGWRPVDGWELLEKHDDAYRYQLVAARWLEGAGIRIDEGRSPTGNDDYTNGQVEEIRDLVAQLRRGEFLPGGWAYDETVASKGE